MRWPLAVRQLSPGVAVALVDLQVSEVCRQRAFGLAHGLVLEVLDGEAQRSLLQQIEVPA